MVTLDEFKKALGKEIDNLADSEIERLSILLEKLAGSLFVQWNKQLAKKQTILPNEEKEKKFYGITQKLHN